jgi:hypothetical protein
MAPEQARSAKVLTTAVDVYSLGAILYELVTGRPPFRATTPLDTILQVLNREPERPHSLNPQVDRDLEIICLKCLQKEPEQRYGSAGDLADDLQRFLDGKPIAARPVSSAEQAWRWCRRNPVLALACGFALTALVVGTIISTLFGLHANHVAEKEFRTSEKLRDQQTKTQAALNDAKTERRQAQDRLVQMYVSNGVRGMDEGDLFGSLPWFVKALEEEQGGQEREEMHRMRLSMVWHRCPRLVQLWVHPGANHAEFSPDDRQVVATSFSHAMAQVWNVNSGQAVALPFKHNGGVYYASFSPDGRRVVTASEDQTARVWDADTRQEVIPQLKHNGPVRHAAFSPDGRWVLTASDDQTARVWDSANGQPISPPLKHNGRIYHASSPAEVPR